MEVVTEAVHNDGYNEIWDKIEIYINDNGYYTLLISTEGNSLQAQKWIATDETIIAPNMKSYTVWTFVIPLYSQFSYVLCTYKL